MDIRACVSAAFVLRRPTRMYTTRSSPIMLSASSEATHKETSDTPSKDLTRIQRSITQNDKSTIVSVVRHIQR